MWEVMTIPASDYVKTLLYYTEHSDTSVIDAIYESIRTRLLFKLSELELQEVPSELEYIVDEVTIARYNRISNEGMESESVEGMSNKFKDVSVDDYRDDIRAYINRNKSTSGKGGIRFL